MKPRNIRTNHGFMGSPLGNSESETILRNIILMQKKQNPEEWKPFSWDDYKAFCTHNVRQSEKGVLEAMVNGGKPVWNCTVYLSPGWLEKSEDKYKFSEKLIKACYEKWPVEEAEIK